MMTNFLKFFIMPFVIVIVICETPVLAQFGFYISDDTPFTQQLLGDVSGNGVISAYDAALILQHVVGIINLLAPPWEVPLDIIDVSNSDTISALDAALVLQFTVGLITEFPPSAPALSPKEEQKLLASAISKLEGVPLSEKQKRVLEQLKDLVQPLPGRTELLQNYPNPFNPETWMPYQLASDSPVIVNIYNVNGQLVRTLNLGVKQAGVYITRDNAAYWDGKDNLGQSIASGLYFYTLKTKDFMATRRMFIIK